MESFFSCYSTVMSCRRPLPSNGTLDITPDEPCQHHQPFNISDILPSLSKHYHHQTHPHHRRSRQCPRHRTTSLEPTRGACGCEWKEKRARRVSLSQCKRKRKRLFSPPGKATFVLIEYISPVFAGSPKNEIKINNVHSRKKRR